MTNNAGILENWSYNIPTYPERAETYPNLIVPLRNSHPITAIARLEMISPHTMYMYPLQRGD